MPFAPIRAARFVLTACAAVSCLLMPGFASGQERFPFNAELRLDTKPMKGSKRVPWLQFSENGTVDIDLWCASGQGRAILAERAISIVPTSLRDNQCSQAQLDADKEFLTSLMQVTAWRWEGSLLVLEGPEILRWRPASN